MTINDKLADTLIGNNRDLVVADKAVLSSHEFVCSLSEACSNVPTNAQYVSIQINGATIEVKSASDVLTWVCRKMWVTRMARLLPILRSRKYSWFKTDSCGMIRPLRISFNCYVDLDRFGATALSRAVQVLEWSVPRKAVTITYRLPIEQIQAPQKVVPTNDPERELKDIPSDVLVRTVMVEILKQGRDDGETWENFMSLPRCRRELGLSNSLLHKLKPWEKKEGYAEEYSVLDDDADYMILSSLRTLDRDGFLGWVQNLGISLEEVCSLLHIKLPNIPAPMIPLSPVSETQAQLGTFKDLILKNYPRGIVLNNVTTALLEKEVGKRLDESDLNRIRSEMFARADGVMLYPEMVMGMDGLERMKNRAKELLSEYGMFAYGCLRNEFMVEMRNLSDEKDFARFFDRFLGRDVGMVYSSRDRLGKMMCLGKIEDLSETVSEKVRGILAECGDAMSIDDLLVRLPYLSREVIEYVGQEILYEVVVFELGGEKFLKLLESYYLPDDFSNAISNFVEATESSHGVVSIVLLDAELERRYGEGFRVNFALEDDSVFKQVVLKSFKGRDHNWNRDMFLLHGKRGESNVAEMFLQSHQDVFHEEEFFRYARESRGMNETGMLILTFLRKHCIRMSKEWWISLDGFDRKFGLTDIQYNEIGNVLNVSVGNSRFKPVVTLGDDVYERLPVLQCDGKEYAWNPYVLTSVAVHRVQNARVVNDEPSPYTVTAMILPLDSGEIDDVVTYVLRAFPTGYFADADVAFDYLRTNNVRMTKTKKLVAKIKTVLGMT